MLICTTSILISMSRFNHALPRPSGRLLKPHAAATVTGPDLATNTPTPLMMTVCSRSAVAQYQRPRPPHPLNHLNLMFPSLPLVCLRQMTGKRRIGRSEESTRLREDCDPACLLPNGYRHQRLGSWQRSLPTTTVMISPSPSEKDASRRRGSSQISGGTAPRRS